MYAIEVRLYNILYRIYYEWLNIRCTLYNMTHNNPYIYESLKNIIVLKANGKMKILQNSL